jgi:ATP-dependent exoDNAse (exonuclease V) alpha subunit
VTLVDGRRTVALPADKPLHLDHAYATTVHSSRGSTAERVLIDAATRSRATSQETYYVAISRPSGRRARTAKFQMRGSQEDARG